MARKKSVSTHNLARNRDSLRVRVLHPDQLDKPIKPVLYADWTWAEEPVKFTQFIWEVYDNCGNFLYTPSSDVVLCLCEHAGEGTGFFRRFVSGVPLGEASKRGTAEYWERRDRMNQDRERALANKNVKGEIVLDLDDIEI
jgi:hypothetical protein